MSKVQKILFIALILGNILLTILIGLSPKTDNSESLNALQTTEIAPEDYPAAEDLPLDIQESEERPSDAQISQETVTNEKTITKAEGPAETKVANSSTSDLNLTQLKIKECDLNDFYWYVEGVKKTGATADVEVITDIDKISGTWKCFIDHDPQDKMEEAAAKYAIVTVALSGDDVLFGVDPLRIKFAREGDFQDLSPDPNSYYKGQWKNGSLYLTGIGNINLTKFYTKDGHQYAIGTGTLPDGVEENIALVRP